MAYDFIVSAGAYCQTTHQVRRITNTRVTSLFDWVLAPHDGLIYCLKNNFTDFSMTNI